MNLYFKYFVWCLLNPSVILTSLKKKVIKFYYGRYNYIYYPNIIYDLIKKYLKNNKDIKIKYIKYSKFKNDLSSKRDNEIFEKYHRFENFKDQINNRLILNKIKKWYKIYFHTILHYKKNLIWESYTVSYRIINAITISIRLKDKSLTHYIKKEVIFLLKRLEYFYNGINNHILKNAQAIIYAGIFLKDKNLTNIGFKILFSAEKTLIDKFGFLRESSSSYQLLISNLYLELYLFLKQNKKKEKQKVFRTLKLMLRASNFFNQKNKLVKFGDLTPDKTTSYLEKKIFCNTFIHNQKYKNSIKKSTNKLGKFINIEKRYSNLFLKFNKESMDNFLTHENEDNFHFNFFYKKNLILTGLNRKNYTNLNGALSSSYNLLTINNYGSLINLSNFFHYNFKRSTNSIKLINRKNTGVEIYTNCFKFLNKKIEWKRGLIINDNGLIINDKLRSPEIFDKKIFLHFSPLFYIYKSYGEAFILKSKKKNITVYMRIKKVAKTQIIKKSNYHTETYGKKSKNVSFIFQNDKSKNLNNIIEIKII